MMKKSNNSNLPHFSMSNNIPICTIFSSILKVAPMIATIFSLNGGLLTTSFVYTIAILYLYII